MKVWIVLAVWILVSLSAGFIGSRFPPGEWYQALEKPALNPPSWVFAPVWTLLYILMGIAVWLIWKKEGFSLPVYVFIAQLVLNALWSYLFFGANNLALAFGEIVVLWFMILWTQILFWKYVPAAGAMILPYQLWVSFALYLNLALWRLNA